MSTWSLGDTGDGSTLQNGYLALNSALGLGSSILDKRKAAGVYLHPPCHVTTHKQLTWRSDIHQM